MGVWAYGTVADRGDMVTSQLSIMNSIALL